MIRGVDYRSVLIAGLVKNHLSMHVLFECASCDFLRLDFLDYLKMVLPPNAFKTFFLVTFWIKLHFVQGKRKVCG